MTKLIVAGAIGATLQEAIYWYDLRYSLQEDKHQALLKSTEYWIITVAMIILATVGTWIWFDGAKVDARHYMLVGASFPLIFKAAVPAVARRRSVKAGGAGVLQAYFRLGGDL